MGIYNGLRALLLLSVLQGCYPKIVFPSIDDDPEDNNSSKHFIRSMEIIDSSERDIFELNPDRKLRDGGRWNEWEEEEEPNKKWRNPPDEKTISFQVLDEDPFHHGRPAWPHDEYIMGMGYYDPNRPYLNRNSTSESETVDNNNINNNNNNENQPPTSGELTKYYEWKRLQPRPSPSSSNAFIGPGFYDVGSSSNYYDTPTVSPPEYYRFHFPTHQAIANEGGVEKIQTNSGGNTESVPGTPSESNTNTRHFSPYHQHGSFSDYYKRKRLRLQIHPGLIAAPLAGLAAFGAASALTSKPLLVELGYVRNKPHGIGGGGGVGGGGWGYAGSLGHGYRPYPPFYPPPNPPPIHHHQFGLGTAALGPGSIAGLGPGSLAHGHAHAHGGHGHAPIGGTLYPILRPHRGRPDGERSSSWWNPFSSLTPRLVIE